ncbi:MAG TPA: hypothetical protein VLQ48_01820 [Chloroflexia bacterium]|nr:hypothetical protein [Chloroflexia bacterium]
MSEQVQNEGNTKDSKDVGRARNRRQRDMSGDMQNASDETERWRERTGEEVRDSTDTIHDRSRAVIDSDESAKGTRVVRRR